MSKTFTIILLIIAVGLTAYNSTMVDFSNPFEGDSLIALILILASLCAIILLMIFITSRKIKDKIDNT